MKEIIGSTKLTTLPKDVQDNLAILLERINRLRAAWGKPLTVTSGLRTKEDHVRIYKDIAAKKGVKFDPTKVPMGSQHLKGAAIDLSDPKLELTAWLKTNPDLVKDFELWFEDKNPNWVHAQIFAPKSGKRWFLP